jgi:SM-20-related protein
MVSADFLSRMGLFVRKNFLDAETCKTVRSAAGSSEGKRATVTIGSQDIYDEKSRRTHQLSVRTDIVTDIHSRLLSIKPDLESYFRVDLKGCRPPVFLSYGIGDFFQAHEDTTDDDDLPEAIKVRKVSVVVFLNGTSEEERPDTYSGGALTFYNLLRDPRLKARGFPLHGEEGLLIAFSSRLTHEVQPVTRGNRYSIVSWFS